MSRDVPGGRDPGVVEAVARRGAPAVRRRPGGEVHRGQAVGAARADGRVQRACRRPAPRSRRWWSGRRSEPSTVNFSPLARSMTVGRRSACRLLLVLGDDHGVLAVDQGVGDAVPRSGPGSWPGAARPARRWSPAAGGQRPRPADRRRCRRRDPGTGDHSSSVGRLLGRRRVRGGAAPTPTGRRRGRRSAGARGRLLVVGLDDVGSDPRGAPSSPAQPGEGQRSAQRSRPPRGAAHQTPMFCWKWALLAR